jgi:hypothetical protein
MVERTKLTNEDVCEFDVTVELQAGQQVLVPRETHGTHNAKSGHVHKGI